MRVSYSELGPREFRAAIGELVGVYAAAMNPPERLIGGREAIMDRHAASPGFRCLIAVDDGVVAGFCYGFHGESGQWWHDMVASALASRSGAGYPGPGPDSPEATAWLEDSFEIAELHVLPPYQGAGIGRTLLLSVTDERDERTAVLSTADAQTPRSAALPGSRVHRPADRLPLLRRRAALRGDGRPAAAQVARPSEE